MKYLYEHIHENARSVSHSLSGNYMPEGELTSL